MTNQLPAAYTNDLAGLTVLYAGPYKLRAWAKPATIVGQYTAGNAAGTVDQVVIRNDAGATMACRLAELRCV